MEDLLSRISGTVPGEMIASLEAVYKELEEKQGRFQKHFCVLCKKGCGQCCEHYVPYLTEAEALLASYVVLKENREFEILTLLNNGDRESTVCPLYKKGMQQRQKIQVAKTGRLQQRNLFRTCKGKCKHLF